MSHQTISEQLAAASAEEASLRVYLRDVDVEIGVLSEVRSVVAEAHRKACDQVLALGRSIGRRSHRPSVVYLRPRWPRRPDDLA